MEARTRYNPFLMITEPSTIIDMMDRSQTLRHLDAKICRPLDRPVLRALSIDLVEFDAEIDRRFAEGQMGGDAAAA